VPRIVIESPEKHDLKDYGPEKYAQGEIKQCDEKISDPGFFVKIFPDDFKSQYLRQY
jgi:hypothetical protein